MDKSEEKSDHNDKSLAIGEIKNIQNHKMAGNVKKGDYIVHTDPKTGEKIVCLVANIKHSK